jgi:protein-arginine kinase
MASTSFAFSANAGFLGNVVTGVGGCSTSVGSAALGRSGIHVPAIADEQHLRRGIEALRSAADGSERAHQELAMHSLSAQR